MYCAYCSEKINGQPIQQAGDVFCSLECAHQAAGIDSDEIEKYDDNDIFSEYYVEDDEETA